MKNKKFSYMVICLLVICVLSVFALSACNNNIPKPHKDNLSDWSLLFRGALITDSTGVKIKEIEFDLADYELIEKPITVYYYGGGRVINIDCDVLYKGKTQKDVWVIWESNPFYRADEQSEWISLVSGRMPIQKKGEYMLYTNEVCHKDNLDVSTGSISTVTGVSFSLRIIVLG